MSQLSFADVFNLARETADNRPVIQAGQQIAEMVPTVQRMMSEQYSRSRFIRVFKDTGRHLGRWEVFSDFLSLAASELDIAPNTLSFHLKAMLHAGLVSVEQEGRFLRYRANIPLMLEVIAYLTSECCSENPCECQKFRAESGILPGILPQK